MLNKASMKRARSISKSSENVVSSSKDEPPKKVAKKRLKSVNPQGHSDPALSSPAVAINVPAAPVVHVKPGPTLNSASILGSLPMYGEHLPSEGYVSIPKFAEKTCDNLRVIMAKLKDFKMKGSTKVSLRHSISENSN